jgi:putative oxidoreductase
MHQRTETRNDFMLSNLAPYLLSVLRIVTALLFFEHGTQKLFGFPPGPPYTGFPNFSLLGIAGMLEVAGGLLLLLGLFTRVTAFILCGEMAFAYFRAHLPRGFFPINNMGEITVMMCFFFLYLVAAGAGPWSLDYALSGPRYRRRRSI